MGSKGVVIFVENICVAGQCGDNFQIVTEWPDEKRTFCFVIAESLFSGPVPKCTLHKRIRSILVEKVVGCERSHQPV
mgnify:CR=1 FL=1